MNTEKLEKLKKSLDNKFIPDNVKDKIRNEIEKLESEIKSEEMSASAIKKEVAKVEDKVEVAVDKAEQKAESTEPKKRRGRPAKAKVTPVEPKATQTAIKKTAMVVAKTIRKDGEKWNDAMKRANGVMKKEKVEVKKTTKSELDRLLARVRKNKSLMSDLKGVKDLRRDAMRTAKPVGKRMSESGNVYYEYRANKTDRKTYGKYAFKDGGDIKFVKDFSNGDGIQVSESKSEDGKTFYTAFVTSYPFRKLIPMNENKDIVVKRAKKIYSDMLEYKKSEKFELGGSVVTDLAGHTGGTLGTGNQGMLDGFSNTAYSGLVGETGAMSSGEMFMSGGGIRNIKWANADNKKLGVWLLTSVDGNAILNKSKNATELEKNVMDFYKKRGSVARMTWDDDADEGLSWVTFTDLYNEIKSNYMSGGSVGMANQQVIDDASQGYVNYYLGEGASQGIYKDGGAIKNQYEGKTAKQIWNEWTLDQREHFLADHYDVLMGKDLASKNRTFDALQPITKIQLELHIKQGQYAKGGEIEFQHSNLRIVGTGIDSNGNRIVKVSFPNQKAFSIQSNGNLPETHKLLKNYNKNSNFSIGEIELMEDEITDYVENYGSANQKKSLKIYGSMLDKNNYAKGGGVRKVGNREYSTGRNWTNDHRHTNKSEEHEVNYTRKGKFLGVFAGGGGVKKWSATDISNAKYLGVIEFQDMDEEFHIFELMETDDRIVFGSMSNIGFIESGYIEKDGFSTDEVLQELISDLEIYYNDGAKYTSSIVFNQRMADGGFMDGVYAKGGGVRQVGNREYSLGRNWTNDHRHTNKSENHEVNYNRKRFFAGGGSVNDDTPKIYVADLEAYNNGRLSGVWLDLTDYSDADELMDAINDFLKTTGGEEYAVHDYENLPSSMYSEYMGVRDFEEIYEMMDLAKENDLPLDVAMEIVSQFDRSALDEFTGVYDSEQDFAEQLVDDIGIQSFNDFQYYLEVSDTDRRLLSQDMADGYVDDIRDEDGGNRLIEEAGLDVEEYEEADSERQDEMLDEAREIVYDEYYNNYFEGLSDPYYFLVEEQGLYDAESFANANFVRVDYEKLADALEQDYTFVRHDGQIYVFNIR
jgi:antirestriction protein